MELISACISCTTIYSLVLVYLSITEVNIKDYFIEFSGKKSWLDISKEIRANLNQFLPKEGDKAMDSKDPEIVLAVNNCNKSFKDLSKTIITRSLWYIVFGLGALVVLFVAEIILEIFFADLKVKFSYIGSYIEDFIALVYFVGLIWLGMKYKKEYEKIKERLNTILNSKYNGAVKRTEAEELERLSKLENSKEQKISTTK